MTAFIIILGLTLLATVPFIYYVAPAFLEGQFGGKTPETRVEPVTHEEFMLDLYDIERELRAFDEKLRGTRLSVEEAQESYFDRWLDLLLEWTYTGDITWERSDEPIGVVSCGASVETFRADVSLTQTSQFHVVFERLHIRDRDKDIWRLQVGHYPNIEQAQFQYRVRDRAADMEELKGRILSNEKGVPISEMLSTVDKINKYV